jgi:hypothetical protein
MKKRGRPSVYTLETGRSLAALIADGASKKQACIDAGVAYSSFMRWQARKTSLRARVEEAARICRAKRWRKALLEGLFFDQPVNFETSSHGHNRHPYRDPNAQPVKWMKLIGWWLVHRVPIDATITPEIEASACEWLKVPRGKWEEAKRRFPSLLVKINEKRRRRINYAVETGTSPPLGWTPPDPKNRSTQNVAPYMRFWKH